MPVRSMQASGRIYVRASPDTVHAAILDPAVLARIIPAAESVTCTLDGAFTAMLGLGVGPFRSRQTVILRVTENTSQSLAVAGHATGPFGTGQATGRIDLLTDTASLTLVDWRYDGTVRGSVTLAGSRLLQLAAAAFTGRVFTNLRRIVERTP